MIGRIPHKHYFQRAKIVRYTCDQDISCMVLTAIAPSLQLDINACSSKIYSSCLNTIFSSSKFLLLLPSFNHDEPYDSTNFSSCSFIVLCFSHRCLNVCQRTGPTLFQKSAEFKELNDFAQNEGKYVINCWNYHAVKTVLKLIENEWCLKYNQPSQH